MAHPRISIAQNAYHSCRKPVTLYRIGFQNKTDNAMMLVCQMYVHYFSSQHFEVHDPCFETHILHFPYCQTSGQDTNLCPWFYKDSPIYTVCNTHGTVKNFTHPTRKHRIYIHLPQHETQLGPGQPKANNDFVHLINFSLCHFQFTLHNLSSISFYILLHMHLLQCHSATTQPLLYFYAVLQPTQNTQTSWFQLKWRHS
jgi:hypothetical protein